MSFRDALRDFRGTFATIPADAPLGDLDGIDYVTDDLDPAVLRDGREAMERARAGETVHRDVRQRNRESTPTPPLTGHAGKEL